jgi:hypothetical protein
MGSLLNPVIAVAWPQTERGAVDGGFAVVVGLVVSAYVCLGLMFLSLIIRVPGAF